MRPTAEQPDGPQHEDGRRAPADSGGPAPAVVPASATQRAVGVVVPAGGTSSRFGADKLLADLDGLPVLRHTVRSVRSALPGAPVVVVGPPERAGQAGTGVRVVREAPAGAGPAAAVLAGARALLAGGDLDVVAVVPGDAPWAGTALPALLDVVRAGAAAAVGVAPDGRRQHLLLAVRANHLAGLDPVSLVDAPARVLLSGLDDVAEVAVDDRAALDVDHPAALRRARELGATTRRGGDDREGRVLPGSGPPSA